MNMTCNCIFQILGFINVIIWFLMCTLLLLFWNYRLFFVFLFWFWENVLTGSQICCFNSKQDHWSDYSIVTPEFYIYRKVVFCLFFRYLRLLVNTIFLFWISGSRQLCATLFYCLLTFLNIKLSCYINFSVLSLLIFWHTFFRFDMIFVFEKEICKLTFSVELAGC